MNRLREDQKTLISTRIPESLAIQYRHYIIDHQMTVEKLITEAIRTYINSVDTTVDVAHDAALPCILDDNK